ncbi:MAG: CRISPR-associated helicase Cas3' [Pyrobaculum sp.]
MIAEAFGEALKRLGLARREAVEEALEELDKTGYAVLRAPTAYGKSFASIPLGLAAYEGKMGGLSKVIHVLPMSSITEDLYARALRTVTGSGGEGLRGLECDLLYKYGERWVGYQAWSIDADFKDPLFLTSSLIYTTFDSFILNLYKITPLRAERAPYESARAAIMRSIVILDEAHLYAESGMGQDKAFTALLAAAESLKELKTPTLIATATIPLKLARIMNPTGVVVTAVGEGCGYKGVDGEVVVRDFKPAGSVKAEVVKDVDPLRVLKERSFKKALLIYNTVARAVEAYEKVKSEFDAVLIHGRLSLGDRREAVRRLETAEVVVATQVVEAGVDVEGVDLLVTDAAPLPSLIQRMGRVARKGGEGLALIDWGRGAYESAVEIYGAASVEATWKLLGEGDVEWRNPCPSEPRSYAALLEKYGEIYAPKILEDLKLVLTTLNRLVTLHRKDAARYMGIFCNFARGSVAVPIVVSELCLKELEEGAAQRAPADRGGAECKKERDERACLLMLDARRARHGDLTYDGKIAVVVKGDVESKLCNKIKNNLYKCMLDENIVFHEIIKDGKRKKKINCRKLLALDAEVSRALGARVVVIGLVAREGAYKPGLGWI